MGKAENLLLVSQYHLQHEQSFLWNEIISYQICGGTRLYDFYDSYDGKAKNWLLWMQTHLTLDWEVAWNWIIFLQHWWQKSLTPHETAWHKHLLVLIFQSTFTHGFLKHEHLFVLISSSSTFLQSQWNISTNSVSFVSPICWGRSNINKQVMETLLYQQVRCGDIIFMNDWWTFVRNDTKLTQEQVNICLEWHKTNTRTSVSSQSNGNILNEDKSYAWSEHPSSITT